MVWVKKTDSASMSTFEGVLFQNYQWLHIEESPTTKYAVDKIRAKPELFKVVEDRDFEKVKKEEAKELSNEVKRGVVDVITNEILGKKKLDINGDGIVDDKDKSLAGQVLSNKTIKSKKIK